MPLWLQSNWKLIGASVVFLAVSAYITWLRLERDHYRNAYVTEHAAFVTFKDQTAAQGEIAKQKAEAKEIEDKAKKDAADAEITAALSTLASANGELRDKLERARRGAVSAATSSTGGAPRACFDPALLDRALSELSGIVESGSEAVIKLDGAKRWARGEVP